MADDKPADDLRTLLAQSFDQAASSSDAAPESPDNRTAAGKDESDQNEAGKEAADAEATADTGGARDPATGKFVKQDDGAAGASDAKAGDQAADDKAAGEKANGTKAEEKSPKTDDKASPAGGTREPPARWSASAKAMFKLQTADAQQFLLDRVAEVDADYTRKTQAIADLKKEYEPVQQLFAPHLELLRQKGLTPQTVIRRWADVETSLANGGESALAIVDGIVRSYGLDKAALGRRLGLTSVPLVTASDERPNPAGDAGGATNDDDRLAQLEMRLMKAFEPKLARIDQIEADRQSEIIRIAQARENAVENEISGFKSAVDDKGELLHPYYDEVEPAMIALAQSYVARSQPLPKINDLYDQAVWSNPSTRQALLATQKAAQEAKAVEEARAKAASARRAASSVTGAPGSAQSSRSVRGEISLREQLEEAVANTAA